MNKHASQPRAIYYVVALQIWEYFSFYGMRALLILTFLFHKLFEFKGLNNIPNITFWLFGL